MLAGRSRKPDRESGGFNYEVIRKGAYHGTQVVVDNCNLVRLDYQQEQGLMSSLPLAKNLVEIERVLTTSSTAIFIPFTTQKLFQTGNGALYYGVNAVSKRSFLAEHHQ